MASTRDEMDVSRLLKVLCVAGARPNFMKLAPIIGAIDDHPLWAEPFEKTMHEAGASDNFLARACSGYAVATLH